MNTFKSFFVLELKRLFNWRSAVALFCFFALSMYLIYTGIVQYEEIKKNEETFQNMERLKVEQFRNYEQYGGYGFYLYFMPSPLCIFVHSSNLYTELIGHIDVGEKLNIYPIFKGRKVFAQQGKLLDFSGVILFFGSFMALFYGFNGFYRKEYFKFLSSFCSYRCIFRAMLFSRLILMFLYFISIFIAGVGWVLLWLRSKEIRLSTDETTHLAVFLLIMLLMLVFFYFLGIIIAATKYQLKTKNLLLVLIWLVLVYFFPALVGEITYAKADMMTGYYQSEVNKLTFLMEFEADTSKELDELRKTNKLTQAAQDEMLKRYVDKTLKEIEAAENKLRDQTSTIKNFFQWLSVALPPTFYLSINNEISSRGYENIVDFLRAALETKRAFIEYYTQRRFQDGKPGNDAFVKNTENIYKAESKLPVNFCFGILFMITQVILLYGASYHSFRKNIFRLAPHAREELNNLEIDLNKREVNVLLTNGKTTASNHLYNVLSGKKRDFKGKVLLNGANIAKEEACRRDFVYVCQPGQIPREIKADHLFSFIGNLLKLPKENLMRQANKPNIRRIIRKTFDTLNEKDKGYVLLAAAQLKKCDIFVFHDFAKGMPGDFIKDFREQLNLLKERDTAIIYITDDVIHGRKLGDYMSTHKKESTLMAVNV